MDGCPQYMGVKTERENGFGICFLMTLESPQNGSFFLSVCVTLNQYVLFFVWCNNVSVFIQKTISLHPALHSIRENKASDGEEKCMISSKRNQEKKMSL